MRITGLNKIIKKVFIGLIVVGLYLGKADHCFAQKQFEIVYDTSFIVNSEAETRVDHLIRLTNLLPNYYATSYQFIIGSTRLLNIRAVSRGAELNTSIAKDNNQTKIEVLFPE